jgi:hypothetical protein
MPVPDRSAAPLTHPFQRPRSRSDAAASVALVIRPPRHRRRALARGALSHGLGRAAAALALVGIGLAGCGRPASTAEVAPPPTREQIAKDLDALVAAMTPVDPTLTSDKQDAWLARQREVLERMRKGPRELGLAALERFSKKGDEILDVRAALLEIAAHCAPEETAPVLEQSIKTYDGAEGLGLRTRAVDYLAATSPQRAVALYEPVLRDPGAHSTRPSQEAFVRGWATAARKLGITEATVLCDLAVDLQQPADARYAAIAELGRFGGKRATKALQEVLVESSSDGLMRRKAAQQLVELMPRREFCERITEVSEHESDENFLVFLDSMLQRYCAE